MQLRFAPKDDVVSSLNQATSPDPTLPSSALSGRSTLAFCFERASAILWLLALGFFAFPFRLTLVEGRLGTFPSSFTGFDLYLADMLLLGAFGYWIIRFTIYDLRFTIRGQSAVISQRSSLSGLIQLLSSFLFPLSFLLWAGLSLLWAEEKAAAGLFWLRIAEGMGLLGLTSYYVRRYGARTAAWALTLAGALEGGLAIEQFLKGEVVSLANWPQRYAVGLPDASVIEAGGGHYLLRAYGTFSHPNLLGGFSAVAALAALWLIWHERSIWRILALGLMLLVTAGVVLSFSRGAWLGLALAGLVAFGLWLAQGRALPAARYNSKRAARRAHAPIAPPAKKRLWLGGLVALLVVAGSGAALTIPAVQNRLFDLNRPLEQRSIEERVEYAGTALEFFKQRPLLGVGLNNFTVVQVAQQPRIESVWPVHNVPLLLAAELGLPGLVLWLVFPVMLLWAISRAVAQRKMWSIWAAGFLIMLVISQVDHYPWTLEQGQFLFFGTFGLFLGKSCD